MVSAAGLSVWKDGAVFAILIVVLLVKPTGILGRQIKVSTTIAAMETTMVSSAA